METSSVALYTRQMQVSGHQEIKRHEHAAIGVRESMKNGAQEKSDVTAQTGLSHRAAL